MTAAGFTSVFCGINRFSHSTHTSRQSRRAVWRQLLPVQLSRLFPDLWQRTSQRERFWELQRILALLTPETSVSMAWFPALAAVIRNESEPDVLDILARWPLPALLPAEARLWHRFMSAAWETHLCAGSHERRTVALSALVRLEAGMATGSSSVCLARWLHEAREARKLPFPRWRVARLAALSGWRAPRSTTVQPGPLTDWLHFWESLQEDTCSITQALAVQARLNLIPWPGRHVRSSGPAPEALLHALSHFIRLGLPDDCRHLSVWHPRSARDFPVSALRGVAEAWLARAMGTVSDAWHGCEAAWETLIAWDRHGILAHCGLNLLPHLLMALRAENGARVLPVIARWRPPHLMADTNRHMHLHLNAFLSGWHQRCRSPWTSERIAAWTGLLHLFRSGVFPAGEDFQAAYVTAVAEENDAELLLLLAQWVFPCSTSPGWQQAWERVWLGRLADRMEEVRLAAVVALWNRLEQQDVEDSD